MDTPHPEVGLVSELHPEAAVGKYPSATVVSAAVPCAEINTPREREDRVSRNWTHSARCCDQKNKLTHCFLIYPDLWRGP